MKYSSAIWALRENNHVFVKLSRRFGQFIMTLLTGTILIYKDPSHLQFQKILMWISQKIQVIITIDFTQSSLLINEYVSKKEALLKNQTSCENVIESFSLIMCDIRNVILLISSFSDLVQQIGVSQMKAVDDLSRSPSK